MPKKAIVLGANGYLAQNLVMWLLNNNWMVHGVGRQDTFIIPGLSSSTLSYQCIKDLTDINEVAQIDLSADIVFMMAGKTGTAIGFDQYALMTSANELALMNVMHTMYTQKSTSRLVFPSTRLVYRGDEGKLLDESDEKETKTVYAVNKLACEGLLHAWANAGKITYTTYRICVPYGHIVSENYSYGTLGFMVRQAQTQHQISLYGSGEQRRTFTHVEDIAVLLTLPSLMSTTANQVYNIGSTDHYSLSQIASIISEKTGCTIQNRDWPELDLKLETGDTMFDDAKLQKVYPYQYQKNIENYFLAFNS